MSAKKSTRAKAPACLVGFAFGKMCGKTMEEKSYKVLDEVGQLLPKGQWWVCPEHGPMRKVK